MTSLEVINLLEQELDVDVIKEKLLQFVHTVERCKHKQMKHICITLDARNRIRRILRNTPHLELSVIRELSSIEKDLTNSF